MATTRIKFTSKLHTDFIKDLRQNSKAYFEENNITWIGAVILTAFYYPLNFWSFSGYEVSIIVLLLNLSIYLTIKSKDIYKFKD